MAKEIKINIRLIIDGKEQGCDSLSVFVWAFPFKEDQVSKCIPTNKIKNELGTWFSSYSKLSPSMP